MTSTTVNAMVKLTVVTRKIRALDAMQPSSSSSSSSLIGSQTDWLMSLGAPPVLPDLVDLTDLPDLVVIFLLSKT